MICLTRKSGIAFAAASVTLRVRSSSSVPSVSEGSVDAVGFTRRRSASSSVRRNSASLPLFVATSERMPSVNVKPMPRFRICSTISSRISGLR